MDKLTTWLPEDLTWAGVLITVAVLIMGWVGSRFARRGCLKLLSKLRGITPNLAAVLARLVSYAILLLAVGIALALMGANIQPLLAVVIVVGVVLVLVLRGVSDNFAAGVIIQSRRTLVVGDEVQVDGPDGAIVGRVLELNARAVVILSKDGRTVHLPNAKILSDAIVNHSRHQARRSQVQLRVALPQHRIDDFCGRLTEAVGHVPGLLGPDSATIRILAVSPERTTLTLRFWHRPTKDSAVTSAVVRAVAAFLAAEDVRGTVTSNPGPPPLIPEDPQ